MRSTRLLFCVAALAAMVALVGCSGNKKDAGKSGTPPVPHLKDAPKDSDAPITGATGHDPSVANTKNMAKFLSGRPGARK